LRRNLLSRVSWPDLSSWWCDCISQSWVPSREQTGTPSPFISSHWFNDVDELWSLNGKGIVIKVFP
jgi:hypothetical protein